MSRAKEAGLSSSNSECLFNPPIPSTPRLEISTFLLELPIKQSDSPRSPSSKEEYSTSDLERENNTEEDEVVARNLLLAPSSPSELNSNSDCAMSSKSSSSRLTRSSSHQLDNISEHDDFVIILSDDDESSNSSVNRQSHKKIKEKNAISSSDEEFSIKTKKKLQRCSQRTRSSNALNSDVADKVDNANGKEDVRDSKHRSQRQHATNAALSSSDEESSIKMKKKSQRRIQRAQSSGSLNSDDASKLKSDVSQEKNDDEPTSMPRRKRVADFAFSSSDEEGSLKMKKKSQRGIRRTRSSDNLNSDGADAVESNVSDKEDDYKPTIAPQRKPVGRKIKRRACRRQLSSDDENEDAGEFEKVSSPKKKRKPKSEISVAKKSVEGEENEGGSDGEGKGGRKQIRKIIKMKGLSTETKTAEAVERERLKRLEERQKFYNTIVTEEAASEKSAIPTVLIVFDCKKDSNEPPVKVHSELCAHLKPHQREAVQFLWDSLIESVDEHNRNRDRMSGAILAHCMGLGKSLSTITFIHTLLTHTELLGIRTCLIICPVNTVLNWHSEWRQWTPEDSEINVYEVATTIACKFRLDVIKQWHEKGGVLLLGYDMYRNLTTSLLKRTRKPALKKLIPEALIDPGPDIVVCDEGHLLKNYKAGITKAVSSLKTPKRIVLTGTPLQNNLPEYWTMVNFVKPKLLGTAKEFANRFVNPIKNGQHSNSTARDVQLMKRRAHILFKTLDGCVQRKDYSCLTKYLPPRLEYVLKIRLCQAQQDFYNEFIKNYRPNRVKDDSSRSSLFKDQQTLYRIWTHPHTLRMHETREAKKALLRDSTTEEENSSNSESDEASDSSSSSSSSSSSDSESHSKGVKSNGVSDNMPPIKNSASGNAKVEKSSTATISTRSGRKVKMHNNNSSIIDLLSSDDDEVQKDDDEEKEEEEKENDKAIRSIVADSSPDVQMSPTVHSADDDDENNISDRKSRLRRRQNGEQKSSVAKPIPVEKQPWWYNLYKEEYDHRIDVGAKLSTLFLLLQKCVDIGDKLLVFSQSLFSLDLIEWFLAAIDRQWCIGQGMDIDGDSVQAAEFEKLKQADKLNDLPSLSDYFSDIGQNIWRRGKDYERIDGSMSAQMRNQLQKRFNNPRDLRFRLLIISTKAGGLGVNLTGANRLVLFDVSWNPSHDIQSIFRSYRFGQAKPVYIYRLIAQGTMEEKMYDRQVTKQSLALRVIDEQQIDRHFKEEDLRELYTFEPDIWDPETASSRIAHILPKDRLFADLLSEHPELISAYHNHDSLLENRIDEGLSESERKEAWREYEDEKQFGRQTDYQRMLVVNSHQHQNIALLQQQQQQMMQMRIQQALGGAGPANLQTTIDRMFAPMSLPTNLVGAPVGQLPVQIPSSQPQRGSHFRTIAPKIRSFRPDIFSEAFNAMRTTLLTRYPMLARSPSALHEMTMRLFLTSVASEAQRSVAPVASTTTEENGVASP